MQDSLPLNNYNTEKQEITQENKDRTEPLNDLKDKSDTAIK